MQQNSVPRNEDPHERAWVALQMFAPLVRSRIEKALKAAGFGPLEWYDVLWTIERGGPLRQRDLARHMLFERYALSRLIDRMEADGLVERKSSDDDLRGQIVQLTPAGRDLRRRMWAVYSPAIRETMEKLSAGEAAQLAELLAKLL